MYGEDTRTFSRHKFPRNVWVLGGFRVSNITQSSLFISVVDFTIFRYLFLTRGILRVFLVFCAFFFYGELTEDLGMSRHKDIFFSLFGNRTIRDNVTLFPLILSILKYRVCCLIG